MKSTYLVNINSNSKVWAFAMEIAYTKSSAGYSVILLDTSNVPYKNFLSLSRRRFQKRILNSDRIQIIKKRFSAIETIKMVVKTFTEFRQGKNSNSFPSINCGGIELTQILKARISAYLGVREFYFSEVPWKIFKKHTITAKITSNFFAEHFPQFGGVVIAYNGREIMSAVLLQHAFKNGFPTIIGERGSDSGKYQLFEKSPHYHPNWWELISNYKNQSLKKAELLEKVASYENRKLTGFDTYFSDIWNPPKALIEGTSLGLKDYILYLSSSSTEYSPFEIFNSKLGFQDQFEAVGILAGECLKENAVLVIRRHPKSLGIDGVDRERKFWEKVSQFKNVVYIGPTETFSSYKLVQEARLVFVWKSSMGYESMLMGKPTYALGTSKWGWDPQVQCWSQAKISDCIRHPRIESASKDIVEKFSQFMSSSGTDFTLFSSVEKWGVTTKSGDKIFNLFLERLRRRVYDYMLIITKKERTRNA